METLSVGNRVCRGDCGFGTTTSRGKTQRCSLEHNVLAVPLLDGMAAHRSDAELNSTTALDKSINKSQKRTHIKQPFRGFTFSNAINIWHKKFASKLKKQKQKILTTNY